MPWFDLHNIYTVLHMHQAWHELEWNQFRQSCTFIDAPEKVFWLNDKYLRDKICTYLIDWFFFQLSAVWKRDRWIISSFNCKVYTSMLTEVFELYAGLLILVSF